MVLTLAAICSELAQAVLALGLIAVFAGIWIATTEVLTAAAWRSTTDRNTPP
ncbi:hypothetical protein [Bradyrhizobium sp.]|uniref:hypothetical protein n=1 Tax=Bradyrhizobium sp. TaxID=376 RepID=UPI003C75C3F0